MALAGRDVWQQNLPAAAPGRRDVEGSLWGPTIHRNPPGTHAGSLRGAVLHQGYPNLVGSLPKTTPRHQSWHDAAQGWETSPSPRGRCMQIFIYTA